MKAQESTLDLKILAAIGAFAIFAAICVLPLTVGYFALRGQLTGTPDMTPQGMTSTSTTIGEEGDPCGGQEHLPCRPGLMCTGGVCMKAAALSAQLLHRSGESCTTDAPCAVGLYCKASACADIDATAPHATSVKIEGATFEDGVYRVALNAASKIVIQTVNAAGVTIELVPKDGFGTAALSQWLSQPKRQTGGIYTSTLKFPRDFDGKLDITVASASHDTSYVSVDVASAK